MSTKKIQMIEKAIQAGQGYFTRHGALVVETGKHTGRAVKDRYVVRDSETESRVNWGKVNQAFPEELAGEVFAGLERKLSDSKQEIFTYEGYVAGFPLRLRSPSAWHIAFAMNMFRSEPRAELERVLAGAGRHGIEILHDPHGKVSDLGVHHGSDTLILLDPTRYRIAIIGTAYAGEIKKSAFTMCNYYLPQFGVLTMHASANCLPDGTRTCVLFGLSGTGKTTLSASHDRELIGDDEIVWSDAGIFNLEGGCYAKLINLSKEKEPEIHNACNRFGAILENVGCDRVSREVDFADARLTENTRGSYDIHDFESIFDQDRPARPPETVVFLMADAFGAMPAVAKLSPEQACHHFLSGYTAKVAGTELGVKEPTATFSACFGEPFMPLHAEVYAKLLVERARKAGATFWILNTGWMEGGFGVSERFPIPVSRALLAAIQSGELAMQKTVRHPVFEFEVPVTCPGVDPKWLKIPEGDAVTRLAERFSANFAEKFAESSFAKSRPGFARETGEPPLRVA